MKATDYAAPPDQNKRVKHALSFMSKKQQNAYLEACRLMRENFNTCLIGHSILHDGTAYGFVSIANNVSTSFMGLHSIFGAMDNMRKDFPEPVDNKS